MSKFLSFYVAAVVQHHSDGEGFFVEAQPDDSPESVEAARQIVEASPYESASYFTVYGRREDGTTEAIADRAQRADAREIAALLTAGLPSERSLIEEAVADIAYIAGCKRHYSGDSRADISDYINWAHEFEATRVDHNGEYTYLGRAYSDTGSEYMSAVEDFATAKLGAAGNCHPEAD